MATVTLASDFFPVIAARLRRELQDVEVVELNLGTRLQPIDDLERHQDVLARTNAIVALRGIVDDRVFALAPRCRIVQQVGAGVDTVDLVAAARRHIAVCNVPSRLGGNAESVAELALFHLIAAGRNLPRLQQLVREEDFGAPFGTSLYGKTVVIVGFGNIGHALARLLRPFRCRIIGIRRRVGAEREAGAAVWASERLPEAASVADFLVVTIPLTTSTEGIVGRRELSAIKPGAWVINVSRGATVDREALLEALESGRVAGAGLDVFWQEPIPADDEVLGYTVTATPHCGGLTDHMLAGTTAIAAENIRRAIAGRRPRYRVRL